MFFYDPPKNGRQFFNAEFGDLILPTRFIYSGDGGDLTVRLAGTQNEITILYTNPGAFFPIVADKIISWTGIANSLYIFW